MFSRLYFPQFYVSEVTVIVTMISDGVRQCTEKCLSERRIYYGRPLVIKDHQLFLGPRFFLRVIQLAREE